MKISNKITCLVLFLLAALGANTYLGLNQLSKVSLELRDVANKDIVLTQISTSITQHQLEKTIRFERMLAAAEELNFENLSVARKKYLLDYVSSTKQQFDKFAESGALDIIKGKEIIREGIKKVQSEATRDELRQAKALLVKIEKAHIDYDALIQEIYALITTGKFELSFEDLDRIQQKERRLSRQLKSFPAEIQEFTRNSLDKAKKDEAIARNILFNSLMISIFISLLVAFMIIRSISRPLKDLVGATHKISEGDFVVNLDDSTKDEVGEVSGAFNTMSSKLAEAREELNQKNKVLAQSLAITEEQKQDLEKVNKELDRFAHTVSHDIKAPLMGIAWYGDYLQKKFLMKLDKKGKESIEGIVSGVKRLEQLINDLLALSRIARVKNPYEKVAMNSIIESVLERLEYNIRVFKVKLDVEQEMPEVVCDRIKITEVFLNLINNAIKFASKDKKKVPEVQVRYRDGGDYHQFSVKDNGIGIDPKFHDEIFQVFRRLHSSEDYEGSGAGLTIVKESIVDHGGKIWVESTPGEGATFLFTIPKNLKTNS